MCVLLRLGFQRVLFVVSCSHLSLSLITCHYSLSPPFTPPHTFLEQLYLFIMSFSFIHSVTVFVIICVILLSFHSSLFELCLSLLLSSHSSFFNVTVNSYFSCYSIHFLRFLGQLYSCQLCLFFIDAFFHQSSCTLFTSSHPFLLLHFVRQLFLFLASLLASLTPQISKQRS